MTPRHAWMLGLVGTVGSAACGDVVGGNVDTFDDTARADGDDEDGGGDGVVETSDAPDGPDGITSCDHTPRAAQCACDTHEDCASGYCLAARSGARACAAPCAEGCPEGLACRRVAPPGSLAEATFLCVDLGVALCRPCRANGECAGDFGASENRCVRFAPAVGAFCGVACGASDPACPPDFDCKDVPDADTGNLAKQCVPRAGTECTCSAQAIAELASTDCSDGACVGVRACGPGGLAACDAPAFASERCDGLDNDCDGTTDQGFPNADGDALADCVDPDDDGDGRDDGADNCPLVGNPDQDDADSDGAGDACDKPDAPHITATIPASPANDHTPVVVGTAATHVTVTLYQSAACDPPALGSGAVDAQGTFHLAILVGDDTRTALRARAFDPRSGLDSDCAAVGFDYHEDSTAPTAPVLERTEPASPATATEFTLAGKAEPGAQVVLYSDAGCTAPTELTAIAGADGTFAVRAAVEPNQARTVFARAIDAAGNASACSLGLGYANDTIAPDAPIFDVTIPESPSASSTTPVLVGHAETRATLRLFTTEDCSGAVVGNDADGVKVDADGIFTVPVAVPPNSVTTFSGTVTDAAGNVSACASGALTYIHDDQDPADPVLAGTSPGSPGNSTHPSVFGTAEPFAQVSLFLGNGCTGFRAGDTSADDTGAWQVSTTVAAQATTYFYGQAFDRAGRASACTAAPLAYVHDDVAPDRPTIDGTAPHSPGRDPRPQVVGSAEVGAVVTLYRDAACSLPANANGNATTGAFAVAIDVAANVRTTLWATATDAAANGSPCSLSSASYLHDDRAPVAPVLTATRPESPASTVAPVVIGVSEPDAAIAIYDDPQCAGEAPLGQAFASSDGAFEVAVAVAAGATSTLYAAATDRAGNRSPCTTMPLTYTHDGSEPLVPAILTALPPSPNHTSTAPTLAGTAEAGATVRIHRQADCADAPVATTVSNTNAAFTVVVGVTPNSVTVFYVDSVDGAQNASPCSPQGFTYRHDDRAPAAPTFVSASPPSPNNDSTTPELRGTAEAGATVTIYNDAACLSPMRLVAVNTAGDFAVVVQATSNTTTSFHAVAADDAGNRSPCGVLVDYVHDGVAPDAPTLTATAPLALGSTTEPDVLGIGEAGATIRFFADASCSGSVIGTGPAAADGSVRVTARVAANATSNLRATATDAVGNESACSAPIAYTSDTLAPARPIWRGSEPTSPSSDPTPSVVGQTDAGARVELFTDPACAGDALASTSADNGGVFAFEVSVAGPVSQTGFYARAIDAVGNGSACSDALVYVHDAEPPFAPFLTGPASPPPGNDATPDVTGTVAESGLMWVRVYANPTCHGVPVAEVLAPDTQWTAPAIAAAINGTTAFSARASDRAGNVSDCSTAISYTHDGVAPAVPVFTTSPLRRSNTDHAPTVTGNVPDEAGGAVTIWTGADCTGQATAVALGEGGGFAEAIELGSADIQASFSARATDLAGNDSACSGAVLYDYDITPPATPSAIAPAVTSITVSAMKPTWTAAATPDNRTAAADMRYVLCRSEACEAADCDFADLGDPRYTTTTAGNQLDLGTIGGLSTNRRYYFTVRALDEAGNLSAAGSNVVSAKTLGLNGAADLTVGDLATVVRVASNAAVNNPPVKWGGGPVPVIVHPAQYSLGSDHSCALNRSGVAYCWGSNTFGQLGNDSFVSSPSSPVGVVLTAGTCGSDGASFCAWKQIDVGFGHTCGLLNDGTVRCWGRDGNGQGGNGAASGDSQKKPVKVVTDADATAPLDRVVQIAVGDDFACALRNDGAVWCWGYNGSGQLGLGGSGIVARVFAVPTLATDMTQIVAGKEHACGLHGDGTIACWGLNTWGELGDGALPTSSTAPVTVSGIDNAVLLGTGRLHTCAVLADGTAKCWGSDASAECGAGASQAGGRGTPVVVTTHGDPGSPLTNIVQIGGGDGYTCARLGDGTVRCWGLDTGNRLGNGGSDQDTATPTTAVMAPIVAGAIDVSIDHEHGCAVATDGTARCWGRDDDGQLGTSEPLPRTPTYALPVAVAAGPGVIKNIETGAAHTCAIDGAGRVWCWGRNTDGQLGLGDVAARTTPQMVPDLAPVKALQLGEASTCALTADGTVWCWGHNGGTSADGRLVPGNTQAQVLAPAEVSGFGGARVRALAVGKGHQCAIDVHGTPWCWGVNGAKQADPQSASAIIAAPTEVKINVTPSAGAPAVATAIALTQIAAGGSHSCGLVPDGRALCWGDNASKQLGYTSPVYGVPYVGSSSPVNLFNDGITITTGGRSSCVVRAASNGVVVCWGSDAAGQLANGGSNIDNATPVVAPGVTQGATVSGGDDIVCMTYTNGLVACAGDNDARALQNANPETQDASLFGLATCLP